MSAPLSKFYIFYMDFKEMHLCERKNSVVVSEKSLKFVVN